ncbi:MAG TPA: energy transducer TonB, partial [Chitinophagaceae bacterium]
GAVIFFAACNNSDYTKSPAEKTDTTTSNPDTSMSTKSSTDTSAGSMTKKKMSKAGTVKKNRKVTIGAMSTKANAKMPDKNGIYEVTDVRPSFPGGHDALENYIGNNIDYSQTAVDDNTEGTVDVQFVVDENGDVMDAKAIGKPVGNGLDDAAVKAISNMPKWTPGKVKGKDVKTRVVLPVTYKMEQ